MAKLSLLEIVQDILNDLDSDEVNSINDTVEALQIAAIVKTTYLEIISNRNWPHLKELVQLTASGTTARPTHMTIPTGVQEVLWINYNKQKSTGTKAQYTTISYRDPEDFILRVNARDSSASNVLEVTDPSGIRLNIITDTAPSFYTSFNDEVLVFDSYDSDVDSTLQTSKTQMYVYKEPTLSIADATIPDLPAKNFPYLLAEAKSVAFNVLRQAPNAKEEQRSRRQRTWSAREKWRTGKSLNTPDFGRK